MITPPSLRTSPCEMDEVEGVAEESSERFSSLSNSRDLTLEVGAMAEGGCEGEKEVLIRQSDCCNLIKDFFLLVQPFRVSVSAVPCLAWRGDSGLVKMRMRPFCVALPEA